MMNYVNNLILQDNEVMDINIISISPNMYAIIKL